MRLIALLLLVAPAGALAQPDRVPPAHAGADALDAWVEIGLGQTARYGDTLAVTFLGIEDSRCPQDVECVWQGEIVAHVRVEERGAASEIRLALHPWTVRPAVPYTTPEGWTLEAGALTPVPPRRLTGAVALQRPYRLKVRWTQAPGPRPGG